MNDIVERLREEARYRADELDFDDEHPSAILARLIETEAADEIERLRARLAEIENWVDRYAVKYVTHQHALMEIAKVLDNWREDKS